MICDNVLEKIYFNFSTTKEGDADSSESEISYTEATTFLINMQVTINGEEYRITQCVKDTILLFFI